MQKLDRGAKRAWLRKDFHGQAEKMRRGVIGARRGAQGSAEAQGCKQHILYDNSC